jgi:hypothetical protein
MLLCLTGITAVEQVEYTDRMVVCLQRQALTLVAVYMAVAVAALLVFTSVQVETVHKVLFVLYGVTVDPFLIMQQQLIMITYITPLLATIKS